MTATDTRVWTRAELLDVLGRPKIRTAGDQVRIDTRFTPRPNDPDNARYELISPCCGKRTYVQQWYVNRMDSGQRAQTFECGRPWAGGRGNPRNGGCRAQYEVAPALIEDGHPSAFDLTWTGYGEVSKHPGGSGPPRRRS